MNKVTNILKYAPLLLMLIIFSEQESEAKLISDLVLDQKKGATVLIFISKDCPCSKGNLPYLNTLVKDFSDFQFIAIHSKKNASDDEVLNYLQNNQLDFDVVNDKDLVIANKYKALKTPHVFIIKNDTTLYSGGVTNSTMPEKARDHYLYEALNQIKNKQALSRNNTKTLGCFIVR